jgi:hypothetical protein
MRRTLLLPAVHPGAKCRAITITGHYREAIVYDLKADRPQYTRSRIIRHSCRPARHHLGSALQLTQRRHRWRKRIIRRAALRS